MNYGEEGFLGEQKNWGRPNVQRKKRPEGQGGKKTCGQKKQTCIRATPTGEVEGAGTERLGKLVTSKGRPKTGGKNGGVPQLNRIPKRQN